jgi:8-oxo-dGTP diphosphatase
VSDDAGKILTLLRSDTKKWDLPGGGVEIPETNEVALRREIAEEAGLEVTDIAPVHIHTAQPDGGGYFIFVAYSCRAKATTVTLSEEHTEFRWVTRGEFLGLDATPYLKAMVQELV